MHYIYDQADHIIAEVDGSTAPQTLREYIWLDDQPIAVVSNVNTASPQLLYVHADHLNRPVMMTDQSRAKIWEASYKPFGEVQSVTGLNDKTQRFPGQWYQIETGLTYNWHRHYDGTIGRYLQADPLGLEAGKSLYGYANQSPLTTVNPDGKNPIAIPLAVCARYPSLCAGIAFYGYRAFEECINYMAKGGNQNKDNEYSREARKQPDPCGWLRQQYQAETNSSERNKIKTAQKVLGCRQNSSQR